MIPVARIAQASVTGHFELVFKCRRCGERRNVIVRATSKGEATGLPIGGDLGALAEQRAGAHLADEARDLVGLARCPECRARSAAAMRGWLLVSLVQIAFILTIFVVVPALGFHWALGGGGPSAADAAWLLLLIPFLAARFVLRLRHVDRRVVFQR